MRERGLKYVMPDEDLAKDLSLPMRERGLKFEWGITEEQALQVAPHAGAWIEIRSCLKHSSCHGVAPHAGAWIEML